MTAADRMVPSPVFILSSIRSGSTLLRCMLDTHPLIHAPHELHLVDLTVGMDSRFAGLAMQVAGLDEQELEHLLWDRVLHRQLVRSGKHVIVDKTPTNLLQWQRVAQCWPGARYIFLLRHPVHIVESAIAARTHATPAESTELVHMFLARMCEARDALRGLTIRYEELTDDPKATTRTVCDNLDVEWEPGMVEYGQADHGPYLAGIGDFTDRIRTGRVLPSRALPTEAETPEPLRPFCRALGYA